MPRAPHVPGHVSPVLTTLWTNGHAAYLVGGSLRDDLLNRPAFDWDVATDARPQRLLALFPGAHYENRFGTVLVPALPGDSVEVTTFRREVGYRDRRRPDHVEFSDSLVEDLGRRDLTVNAIAFGRPGDGQPGATDGPRLEDPTGGLADLDARLLRAVGDPRQRFDEDALRLLRVVRLSAQLDFAIEPATQAALVEMAPLVAQVSAERVGQELRKMLAADPPSRGFGALASTGLLEYVLPVLAAQRGVPQAKLPGMDLWAHTLATLDAAGRLAPGDETLLLAALLHDIGKPETLADGHFHGHEAVGAERAQELLHRLAVPRREAAPVVELVRWHMYGYESRWGDAAVRRFIRTVGRDILPRLFLLREADNLGSGAPADAGGLDELRERVAAELERGVPLATRDLVVDGHILQAELDLAPGPQLGALLERLLESVVSNPSRNRREMLLADARTWLADGTMAEAAQVTQGSETAS
ncbi:MAG: CCA tRNA nucleotidyltransferase [Candidatus Limnocylindrales bacterium]